MRYIVYLADGTYEKVDRSDRLTAPELARLVDSTSGIKTVRPDRLRILVVNPVTDGLPRNNFYPHLFGTVVQCKQLDDIPVGFEMTECPVCKEQYTDCDMKQFGIIITKDGCGFCPTLEDEAARERNSLP